MMRNAKFVALGLLGSFAATGCATKGYVNRSVATVSTALETERTARTSADEAQGRDIAALRTDLASLRNDLQGLRTEFGARITAMEDQVKFDMPVHFGFNDATVRQEDTASLTRFAQVIQKHYPGAKVT